MPAAEESTNKATLRRLIDAANAHDERIMSQTFGEVIDPDVVVHNQLPSRATGAEAMTELFVTLHRGFLDLHVRIDDLLEDGDKVVARQTVTWPSSSSVRVGRSRARPPATWTKPASRYLTTRQSAGWGAALTIPEKAAVTVQ